MILLILSPISWSPSLQRHHVGKSSTDGHVEEHIFLASVFVEDIFDEEKDEHVVLILRGIRATSESVAAFPEGAVEFRFLDGHLLNGPLFYQSVAIYWRVFDFQHYLEFSGHKKGHRLLRYFSAR